MTCLRLNNNSLSSHLSQIKEDQTFIIILERCLRHICLDSTCSHYLQRGRLKEASAVARTVSLLHVSLVPLLSVSSTCRRETLCTASSRRTLCGPWRASTLTSTTGFRLPIVCPGTGCWTPLQWVLSGTNYCYNEGCWHLHLIEIGVMLGWSHSYLRIHHVIAEIKHLICCLFFSIHLAQWPYHWLHLLEWNLKPCQ